MKFNMPMAVFGGLALIAAAIAVPQIIEVQVISEANAAMDLQDFRMINGKLGDIAEAITRISACRN
jgi:hypothetical protein